MAHPHATSTSSPSTPRLGTVLTFGALSVWVSGCVLPQLPPSLAVDRWTPAPPPTQSHFAALPTTEQLVDRWSLPEASPWSRYEKLTLLTAEDEMPSSALPDVTGIHQVSEAIDAADHLANAGLPSDILWLIDLRGPASVAFGARLSERSREPIAGVMTFNNWPADDEMTPAEETLSALVTYSPVLPVGEAAAAAAHPVFLLDGWRLAYRYDVVQPTTVDNRYMLFPGDLPSVAELQAHGIRRVVYVVPSLAESDEEEDDLNAPMLTWQAAGVRLHQIDVHWLRQLDGIPGELDAWLESAPLRVRIRPTICNDPTFFASARGGFGGPHAFIATGGGFGG